MNTCCSPNVYIPLPSSPACFGSITVSSRDADPLQVPIREAESHSSFQSPDKRQIFQVTFPISPVVMKLPDFSTPTEFSLFPFPNSPRSPPGITAMRT